MIYFNEIIKLHEEVSGYKWLQCSMAGGGGEYKLGGTPIQNDMSA